MTYALAEIETDAFAGRLAIGPLPITDRDLEDIKTWGPSIVVTLTPEEEMHRNGVDGLSHRLMLAGIRHLVLPIQDYDAPDATFDASWRSLGGHILQALRDGDNVLVHCRAGQGRSGTVAARLLIDAGTQPDDAIARVRVARPAAIETAGQVAWLKRT